MKTHYCPRCGSDTLVRYGVEANTMHMILQCQDCGLQITIDASGFVMDPVSFLGRYVLKPQSIRERYSEDNRRSRRYRNV